MERGRRKSDGRRKGGRVQLWYDGGYERPKFRRMTMDEGIDGWDQALKAGKSRHMERIEEKAGEAMSCLGFCKREKGRKKKEGSVVVELMMVLEEEKTGGVQGVQDQA